MFGKWWITVSSCFPSYKAPKDQTRPTSTPILINNERIRFVCRAFFGSCPCVQRTRPQPQPATERGSIGKSIAFCQTGEGCAASIPEAGPTALILSDRSKSCLQDRPGPLMRHATSRGPRSLMENRSLSRKAGMCLACCSGN
jgi:hypothetical protein